MRLGEANAARLLAAPYRPLQALADLSVGRYKLHPVMAHSLKAPGFNP